MSAVPSVAAPVAALRLPEVLTHGQASACARALRQAVGLIGAQAGVVVDASALQQFDSSALAVLLDCRRAAESKKLPFAVSAMPPKLRQLAGLYGVADLLPAA